jgi:integrase
MAREGLGEIIMATTKVGVYRSFYGSVPTDSSGRPLPESEWLKKRPFSWVVRWFGSDGDRYSKSFKTRKEADRFAESKQSDVRGGKADPPAAVPLRDYYREHQELMKGNLAPKTLHMQLATLGLLGESLGWNCPLHRIAMRDIERFRAERSATGIAPASANRELKVLKRLFNLAIVRGYLPQGQNPCASVPMMKVGRKRPPYCAPEQFQALCGKARDPLMQALLVVLYTTGVRLREALHLTWADVDFANAQLHVTRKSANGLVQAWSPKDHEMRSIPLTPQAISFLAAWQSTAPEQCPYVFMDQGRWDYYREQVKAGRWALGRDLVNNVLRRFQRLCRKAGVGPFTIHDLRRSCLTNWAQQLAIHVVQQLAGHSDIKTTQQFYLSVQPEDVVKAQAVQAKVLGPMQPSDPTDQKLTNSGRKRVFPKRKLFTGPPQTPSD